MHTRTWSLEPEVGVHQAGGRCDCGGQATHSGAAGVAPVGAVLQAQHSTDRKVERSGVRTWKHESGEGLRRRPAAGCIYGPARRERKKRSEGVRKRVRLTVDEIISVAVNKQPNHKLLGGQQIGTPGYIW